MKFNLPFFLALLPLLSANVAVNDNDWDLLIFTQRWPITVCYEWKKHDPTHSCTMPSQKDAWTVHGIWPTKMGTIGPGFCNKTWPLNVTEITPIMPQLEQYWTNIETGTPQSSLWSHEWQKHGTCAATIHPLNNQLSYFAQGLKWLQNYIMSGVLAQSDILPDKDAEYHPMELYNAVKLHLQKDPVVECIHDERTDNYYLSEIRICFDKSLNLIDCDGVKSWMTQYFKGDKVLTNCNLAKPIVYTNVVPIERLVEPTSALINIYKFITWLRWFTL